MKYYRISDKLLFVNDEILTPQEAYQRYPQYIDELTNFVKKSQHPSTSKDDNNLQQMKENWTEIDTRLSSDHSVLNRLLALREQFESFKEHADKMLTDPTEKVSVNKQRALQMILRSSQKALDDVLEVFEKIKSSIHEINKLQGPKYFVPANDEMKKIIPQIDKLEELVSTLEDLIKIGEQVLQLDMKDEAVLAVLTGIIKQKSEIEYENDDALLLSALTLVLLTKAKHSNKQDDDEDEDE